MPARGVMTHRCTIQRNTIAGTGTDPWNDDDVPNWETHLEDQPCRMWFEEVRSLTDVQDERLADLENRHMILPKGTDVHEDDRVLLVTDRLGTQLFDGPMRVDSVGYRPGHIVAKLMDVR